MALHTQILFATKPGVVRIVAPLRGMTADAGHGLTGPRIENVFTDGMGKHSMLPMAFITDIIDWSLGHRRMVGTMGCVTVVAGAVHRMAMFRRLQPLESRFVTFTADVTLLPLQ